MSSSRMDGTRVPTRHFFKVMMPGFFTKLGIPPAFCRRLDGIEKEEAILRSVKGSWHVKVHKCSKGLMYFKEGWGKFVQQHDLKVGDFALFEHRGGMRFNVFVFDSSACEKEFPVKFADHDHQIKKEPNVVNSPHEHVRHIKRERLDETGAWFKSERPFFVATIRACHGSPRRPYMNIPAKFLKSNDLGQLSSITLRDPSQKLWSVKLRVRANCSKEYRRISMAKGWHEFYASSKLKEGDVCIFELNRRIRRSKTAIMDVKIFPCTS